MVEEESKLRTVSDAMTRSDMETRVQAGPAGENQGAVGLLSPNSLIMEPFPPVTGALGVIGLVAGPN